MPALSIRDSKPTDKRKLFIRVTVEQLEMIEKLKDKYRTDNASHVVRCAVEDAYERLFPKET